MSKEKIFHELIVESFITASSKIKQLFLNTERSNLFNSLIINYLFIKVLLTSQGKEDCGLNLDNKIFNC